MKRPLAPDEAELWRRVAATVRPLHPPRHGEGDHAKHGGGGVAQHAPSETKGRPPAPSTTSFAGGPPPRSGEDRRAPGPGHTLDAGWDRKLARGVVSPDVTIDLHGHTLDAAHLRLDHGIAQALAMGARVVLLVTGRARPHSDHADRSERRGAIRAKFIDWLAHGPHASRIAAIRPAHPRHGGAGAVYLVLRRTR